LSTIKSTIIADSTYAFGERITTYELEYPRFIHGELMTHRMFSRNAASSRAIPIDAIIELIESEPAMPVHWGVNQSGMQANTEHHHPATCVWAWKKAATSSIEQARRLQKLGLHKQVVNRVLEPFQTMKTVVTATEFDNWFHLRNHSDAQPEIKRLAELMYEDYTNSLPNTLKAGEWHLPYVTTEWCAGGSGIIYGRTEDGCLTLEEAKKVSASCCAQISYRKSDESLEKALKIWDMLVTMVPVHASPTEHQATPMEDNCDSDTRYWEDGVTHSDKRACKWSGNFKGWIQHRQLLNNHVCNNYEGEK
jgi:thymidylate synthase ThyX